MDSNLKNIIIELINQENYNLAISEIEKNIDKIENFEELISLFPLKTSRPIRLEIIERFVPESESEKYMYLVSDDDKTSWICKLDKSKQHKYIKFLSDYFSSCQLNEFTKYCIISNLDLPIKVEFIKYLNNIKYALLILVGLSDKKYLLDYIEKHISEFKQNPKLVDELYLDTMEPNEALCKILFEYNICTNEQSKNIRKKSKYQDFLKANIDKFVDLEVDNENERIYIKNILDRHQDQLIPLSYKYLNFEILLPDVVIPGHVDEIIEIINTCRDGRLLDMGKQKLKTLIICYDLYKKIYGDVNEYTLLETIIYYLQSGEFDELINSIPDVYGLSNKERYDLYRLLQDENFFNLKSISQLNNITNIRKETSDNLINGSIDDKKNAVLLKIFGIDYNFALKLINKFEYDKLDDSYIKTYLVAVRNILTSNDERYLEETYNSFPMIKSVDRMFLINQLSIEFGKLYNKNLFVPSNHDLYEGKSNVYDAGTDFNMIISVIGLIKDQNPLKENYNSDWNRIDFKSSPFFCGCYISKDCLGFPGYASSSEVIYGFNNVPPVSFFSTYTQDGGTNVTPNPGLLNNGDLVSPETLEADTYNWVASYNEVDILRFSRGKRLQPAYIVVFKINGDLHNWDNSLKAQSDFNGIPIVVVDVNRCMEKAKKHVLNMIEEYKKTNNEDLSRKIYKLIARNRINCSKFRVGDFMPEIDINMFLSSEKENSSYGNGQITKNDIYKLGEYFTFIDESKGRNI